MAAKNRIVFLISILAFAALFQIMHISGATNVIANNSSNTSVSGSVLKITSFTANSYVISGDQRISLFNTTSGGAGAISYSYNYSVCGCGQMINEGNNSFSFTQPGYYNVTLYVSDQYGDTNQFSIYILVDPVLEITSFTSNAYLISMDQYVSFSNTTSGGTGGTSYNYTICGCGQMINDGNNSFNFSQPGIYNITLNVKDWSGEVNQSTITIQVDDNLETLLSTNTTSINTGQTLAFSNTTSGGTGGNTYALSVNNTSGATVNGNGTITFNLPGTYLVTLNVADRSGEFASSSVTITVSGNGNQQEFSSGGSSGNGDNTGGHVTPQFQDIIPSGISISASGSCVLITNVAKYEDFDFMVAGKAFDGSISYIGSNYTSIVIDNTTYTAYTDAPIQISSNPYATIKLTGIQGAPQTVNLLACQKLYTNVSIDLSLNPTGIVTKSVNPSTYTGLVTITNNVSVPALPNGDVGLFIGNISVNSTSVKTVNVNLQYNCSLGINSTIQPYILQNGTWVPVTPFTLNQSACSVSFTIPADPVVALVQQAKQSTQLKPPVAANPQAKPQSILVETTPGKKNNNNLLLLASGTAIIAVVVMIAARPVKKSKKRKRSKPKK